MKSTGVSPEHSTLIIVCLEDGREWTSGDARLETAYSPASTAKIPHTLIALEEKALDSPDAHFEWDGEKRFCEVWNQDQTISSAFKYSVVWVYQKLTSDLGYKTMSTWIDRFNYGNRAIGTPENLTTYWLEGPLKTSARDQIHFLSALANQELPLAAETFRLAKEIMCQGRGENWVLYAKTGYAGTVGWYVGWVETEKTYVFAFNMDIADWDELPLRQAVVHSALHDLGILSGGDSD